MDQRYELEVSATMLVGEIIGVESLGAMAFKLENAPLLVLRPGKFSGNLCLQSNS